MNEEKVFKMFYDADISYSNKKFRTKFHTYELREKGQNKVYVLMKFKARKNTKGEINWPIRIVFYTDLIAQISVEVRDRNRRLKAMLNE